MKRRDFNKTLLTFPFISGLPIAFGKDKPLTMADKICQHFNSIKPTKVKELGIFPDGNYYDFNNLKDVYHNNKTNSFYIKSWDSYIPPIEYSVSVDWLNKYEQSQRWDVASRAIEIAQQGLKWKIQDGLLKTLMHSAEEAKKINYFPYVAYVYTTDGTSISTYSDKTHIKFYGKTLEIPDMKQYEEYFRQQISTEYDFHHMYIHCPANSDVRMSCYEWQAIPFREIDKRTKKDRIGFSLNAKVGIGCNIIHAESPSIILV